MFLNLSTIRTAHERIDQEHAPAAFASDRELFAVVTPTALGFDIYKDKTHYHLIGRVATTLELACSRCLEPFRWPVDSSFDLRYEPRPAVATDHEREVHDDDLSTAYYDDDTIDLGQLMREQFYLSIPMKPLCTDACKGLCPQCGANRNRGTCGCTTEWQDPRLVALKGLRGGPGDGAA
jgi:uncharacterized protein